MCSRPGDGETEDSAGDGDRHCVSCSDVSHSSSCTQRLRGRQDDCMSPAERTVSSARATSRQFTLKPENLSVLMGMIIQLFAEETMKVSSGIRDETWNGNTRKAKRQRNDPRLQSPTQTRQESSNFQAVGRALKGLSTLGCYTDISTFHSQFHCLALWKDMPWKCSFPSQQGFWHLTKRETHRQLRPPCPLMSGYEGLGTPSHTLWPVKDFLLHLCEF